MRCCIQINLSSHTFIFQKMTYVSVVEWKHRPCPPHRWDPTYMITIWLQIFIIINLRVQSELPPTQCIHLDGRGWPLLPRTGKVLVITIFKTSWLCIATVYGSKSKSNGSSCCSAMRGHQTLMLYSSQKQNQCKKDPNSENSPKCYHKTNMYSNNLDTPWTLYTTRLNGRFFCCALHRMADTSYLFFL